MMVGLIKRFSSLAVRSMAFARFVSLLEKLESDRPNLLRVLTYHRVDEVDAHPELYPGLISATPGAFDEQMAYLAKRFHTLSMSELLGTLARNEEVPPKSVLVTFDDAYTDFAEHAWPIMQRHAVPATMFVATSFPDHPTRLFWWDTLHDALRATEANCLTTPLGAHCLRTPERRAICFRRLRKYVKSLPHAEAMQFVDSVANDLRAQRTKSRVLSWDMLRQLAHEGVELGAHTQNHPMLDRVDLETTRAEVAGSMEDLRREAGSALPIFAYPSGHVNDAVVRAVKDQGVRLAFTTRRGVNDLARREPLLLRRINVGRQTNVALLRAQLSSW